MKCFQCNKTINETDNYEITAPDGDVFHVDCLNEYEKEKTIFFEETIHDDEKYNNYMND